MNTVTLATVFFVAAASIYLVLGAAHLLYTFFGVRLHPRDEALATMMKASSPVISRETTMWQAWVGFNASHSFGAILLALVYGYLAIWHFDFLSQSVFLLTLGFVFMGAYVVLAKAYWFSAPFRGLILAWALYSAGLGFAFA